MKNLAVNMKKVTELSRIGRGWERIDRALALAYLSRCLAIITSDGDDHHVATLLHRVILSGGRLGDRSRRTPFARRNLGSMRQERHYYVYILGSFSGTLYIGVTGSIRRRIWQHKQHAIEGFTTEYDVTRLLYFETYHEVLNAIAREKQLKGWTRAKKVALLEKKNPKWEDLSLKWGSATEQELLAQFKQPESIASKRGPSTPAANAAASAQDDTPKNRSFDSDALCSARPRSG